MSELEIIKPDSTQIVKSEVYESQVDIAKRYPRELKKVINNAVAIATMDTETAQTCGYSLPRAGKKINGASVHLAKIIVQCYGNIRVESRVIGVNAKEVIAEAIAFDLETNIASKREERKSIVTKNGKRYSDDMIITTGKAAASIAYRNVVFDVIPKSIVDKVYKEAMNTITGDLSDETKLIKRRKAAIDAFKDNFAVEENELLENLGLNTTNQIKQDQIVILLNMYNSLDTGEFTVDEMFNRIPKIPDAKLNIPKVEKETEKTK